MVAFMSVAPIMSGRKREHVGVARAAAGPWGRRPAFASDWSRLLEQSNKLRRDMPEGAFVVERGGPRRQGSRRARGDYAPGVLLLDIQ